MKGASVDEMLEYDPKFGQEAVRAAYAKWSKNVGDHSQHEELGLLRTYSWLLSAQELEKVNAVARQLVKQQKNKLSLGNMNMILDGKTSGAADSSVGAFPFRNQ